jgi:hypothetical protein
MAQKAGRVIPGYEPLNLRLSYWTNDHKYGEQPVETRALVWFDTKEVGWCAASVKPEEHPASTIDCISSFGFCPGQAVDQLSLHLSQKFVNGMRLYREGFGTRAGMLEDPDDRLRGRPTKNSSRWEVETPNPYQYTIEPRFLYTMVELANGNWIAYREDDEGRIWAGGGANPDHAAASAEGEEVEHAKDPSLMEYLVRVPGTDITIRAQDAGRLGIPHFEWEERKFFSTQINQLIKENVS